jgi:hypothetical protein
MKRERRLRLGPAARRLKRRRRARRWVPIPTIERIPTGHGYLLNLFVTKTHAGFLLEMAPVTIPNPQLKPTTSTQREERFRERKGVSAGGGRGRVENRAA